MSERSKEGRFTPKVKLPELEPDKWWSWKRAKRGTIITAALVGIGGVVAMDADMFLSPNSVFLKDPGANYIALGFASGFYGTVGGLIDGFKPTSQFVRKEIESFLEIKNDFAAIGKGVVKGAKFLAGVDYGKLAYDVLRPDIPKGVTKHKGEILTYSTTFGGVVGAVGYGTAWFFEQGDRLFGVHSSFEAWYPFLTQHPLETIAGGTALGLAAGAYPLIFHRPFRFK